MMYIGRFGVSLGERGRAGEYCLMVGLWKFPWAWFSLGKSWKGEGVGGTQLSNDGNPSTWTVRILAVSRF